MEIAGGNDNLMIKNTIKRLGVEASEATRKLNEVDRLAKHKAQHVKELTVQLKKAEKKLWIVTEALNDMKSSASWKVTGPLRTANKILKDVYERLR